MKKNKLYSFPSSTSLQLQSFTLNSQLLYTKMSDLIEDDYSNVTVKIEENVIVKKEFYHSNDSGLNIPLSDFIPNERGNTAESYKGEHRLIKSELIESGPSGSSNIGKSEVNVVRVNSHVCLKCDRTFFNKASFNRHINSVHDKLKKYSCGECERNFTQQGNLKEHIDSVHRKLKKYSCKECDLAFTRQGHLKGHEDAVHRKLKRFSCGECDRSFKMHGDLKRHVDAVHRKFKKYTCGECARSFSTKHWLKTHLAAVHEKLKNYLCAECNRGFGSRSNLIVHFKKIHAGPSAT